jgi:hypothetical protein
MLDLRRPQVVSKDEPHTPRTTSSLPQWLETGLLKHFPGSGVLRPAFRNDARPRKEQAERSSQSRQRLGCIALSLVVGDDPVTDLDFIHILQMSTSNPRQFMIGEP